MRLDSLLRTLQSVEPLPEVYRRLDSNATVRLGVIDAAKAVSAALLWRRHRTPTLLIVARESDAEAYAEQLAGWVGDAAVLYPSRGGMAYEREVAAHENAQRRIAVLSRIARASSGDPAPLVVASAAAVAERTMRPADLGRGPGRITRGDQIELDTLALSLVDAGYEFSALVEEPGQAARRGGILDVFTAGDETALRIEFFGSEIDSIRRFDVEDQRTVEQLNEVDVGPASQWFPTHEELIRVADRLDRVRGDEVEAELSRLRSGELPVPELYGPLAAEHTLLDHLSPGALLLIDEREGVDAALSDLEELTLERRADLAGHGQLDPEAPLPHATPQEMRVALDARPRRVEFARWVTGREPGALRLPFQPADAYAGRLADAVQDIGRRQQRRDRMVIATQQAQRLSEVIEEQLGRGAHLDVVDATPDLDPGDVALVQGSLPEGWSVATPSGIVGLVTDRELFGFVKRRRRLRQRATHRSQFLAEVRPGDFVVHADHGIARFGGIVRRPVAGEDRDYLELRYAGEDKLYVPVEQVDRVSRYTGPSGHAPRLTRLGTQEWSRARSRVREAVKVVAGDLVRLYAARQLLQGHPFGTDGDWQRELEASFPFEMTEDQLEAITAVKADMESERPMDRVICGDVGFGKTEVAVRAAFKAIQDGFQVAVLVPTTVLAQQHLRTFSERLAAFPTRIEVLSRFRSDAEARDVIRRTASGEIDILIGTHRLLEANVQFQNLGLVVIDEEQRFGVTHKEQLKRMRLEVDVLTLSATPIPRTLHMALTGIRDMSTIDTPPEGRRPVQTYVMEWDEPAVREAILHELERGGQVYLVHNRAKSIDLFSDEIKKLVPEARVVVGHGQMPEGLLKRVMERFADGDFDVLICTTIIESGIDIPNVNTLIVDRSDRLGLAQMYQLRGRVGRGTNQAYAYLFHPREHVLTEVAQQRLSTIFEASELGAGFQVALRDLEIRGAGNLLGAQQSGHIASLGFDLYTQMLGESVEELRAAHERRAPEPLPHERRNALRSTQIDLPIPAYIPESYIEDIEARLALYQRIAGIGGPGDLDEIARETVDRFGELPAALVSLLDLVRLRLSALEAGIASVRVDGGEVIVTAADGQPFATRTLPRLPSGVRVGRTQLRLHASDLGEHLVEPIGALLRLLAGEREAVSA